MESHIVANSTGLSTRNEIDGIRWLLIGREWNRSYANEENFTRRRQKIIRSNKLEVGLKLVHERNGIAFSKQGHSV